MKNFLLILLGKGTNDSIKRHTEGLFKSECYYDWIKLKIISSSKSHPFKNAESQLIASYKEEIKLRQETLTDGIHIQQGIIALPVDDENDNVYYNFLQELVKTSIIFISFINIPSWSQNNPIISNRNPDQIQNLNELIKKNISSNIDKSIMRLFYTFDHNDLVLICNGKNMELKNYLETLEKIRFSHLTNGYFAIHDITTIYGYKNVHNEDLDKIDNISVVVSVSGKNISPSNIQSSFRLETIGRYDHLSGYKNITWKQISELSKELHGKDVIASRVHIGYELPDNLVEEKNKLYLSNTISSPLYSIFKEKYKKEIASLDFSKLVEIYGNDKEYVDSLKLMLSEIGFAINITLQRGFSKYNSVCYIEPYFSFIRYIKEKIIEKFINESEKNPYLKDTIAKDLAESLVDISNSFYKSILTLDSSIMHSERRFIMSDPHQLTLFDIPPKLIAYYTSIASELTTLLNKDSNNTYVFLITPDIKKDIYVESITRNRDIDNEINILVIHINERSIYNVAYTTKILAHEIAHHVGQNSDLRKERANYFIKCYIALLLRRGLDPDLFLNFNKVEEATNFIGDLVTKLFALVEKSDFTENQNNYFYMDELEKEFHSFIIKNLREYNDIDLDIYKIFSNCFDDNITTKYIRNSKRFFASEFDLPSDAILKNYVWRQILNSVYTNLQEYFDNSEQINEDRKGIRFILQEGYADIQMILLTENQNLQVEKITNNYSQLFKGLEGKSDEMIRISAVINAFWEKEKRDYSSIADLPLICNDSLLERAYYTYICKQASLYFTIVKEDHNNMTTLSNHDELYDYSKTSLFMSNDINKIIQEVDNTIASYVKNILMKN